MTEDDRTRYREARNRILESITQIEQALFKYYNDKGHYPPPVIKDKDGRPLLSWRVELLPYLGAGDVFREFKLDEPWDGPHNKALLVKMPALFASPEGVPAKAHSTFYQALVGPDTAWDEDGGLTVPHDFPDGTNNTIQIVEASSSVPWTKPEDVPYSPDRPLPKLGCQPTLGRFWAGFVDGHCRDFRWDEVNQNDLRALITRSGGD